MPNKVFVLQLQLRPSRELVVNLHLTGLRRASKQHGAGGKTRSELYTTPNHQ